MSDYGLLPVTTGNIDHVVVVLHGIRQTRDHLRPFAEKLAAQLPNADVLLYGYDHTRGLEENGARLASALGGLRHARIDLVGYSMGGLVARLAATERADPRFDTIVTLATPNRGSLGNAELETLGQIGRDLLEAVISPLAPRTDGIKDLTRAAAIMTRRRERLLAEATPVRLRYASVPALFYNAKRTDWAAGPSWQLGWLQRVLLLSSLKARLVAMPQPHDGIVTEASNRITGDDSTDWSEVHLAERGGAPVRVHAVADAFENHDHMSILRETLLPRLVAVLIGTPHWSLADLAGYSGAERQRFRFYGAGK
ncbi:hypothetical protein IP88_05830 [alpha proteobacterium AAP81b]|nr:hypothetical protein IP88_05830 [alpha proteobacterium AAP81b]